MSIVPANRVAWTPAGFTHYHRAHGDTDMRIVFLAPSLARLVPDRPAVFLASDLAREVLLALTGPRNYDDTAPASAAPRALASSASSSMNSTKHTNSHCNCPNHKTTDCKPLPGCCTRPPRTTPHWPSSGRRSGASTRTLSRLFRNELGMTFYEWRTQLRIYHALVLLADGHDTTQTAARLRMGQPQQLHRSVHQHHRHNPGPLPNQSLMRHQRIVHGWSFSGFRMAQIRVIRPPAIVEREHGFGDAVVLADQTGLAIDRALEERPGSTSGEVDEVARRCARCLDRVTSGAERARRRQRSRLRQGRAARREPGCPGLPTPV